MEPPSTRVLSDLGARYCHRLPGGVETPEGLSPLQTSDRWWESQCLGSPGHGGPSADGDGGAGAQRQACGGATPSHTHEGRWPEVSGTGSQEGCGAGGGWS